MAYILERVTVIDVEQERVFTGAIRIEGDTIAAVYEGDAPETDAQRVDLEGRYVMPGLIDMHCHIKEGFAPHFTAAGVTTVRNTAGNVIELEKLIHAPSDAPTPRVYASDRMIDGPPGLWGETALANFVTDDPEAARAEVRRQAAAGAQFIKVYGLLSKEAMRAVAEEAKQHGLEVSADLIHSSVTAIEAAELGVTWLEHASGIVQAMYPGWTMASTNVDIDWEQPDLERMEAVCRELLRHNVNLCPTLFVLDQIQQLPSPWESEFLFKEDGRLCGSGTLNTHWSGLAQQEELLKTHMGFLLDTVKAAAKTYRALGGTVVAGTDCPAGVWTYAGTGLHRELELFTDMEWTEMEALQSATSTAAASIGLTDRGTIKAGCKADLLILDQDPLESISNTQTIYQVIKGGKRYTPNDILGHVPSPAYLKQREEEVAATFPL